jgi:hypothetical protein
MKAVTLFVAVLLLSSLCAGKKAPKNFEDVIRAFMHGANLTDYVADSERCMDAIDDTAATFADLIY